MGEATKVARKRRGEWERCPRTTQVDGHIVPYTAVAVKYKGMVWERPDTPERRAEIVAAIQSMDEHERLIAQVRSLRERVSGIAQKVTATESGLALAQAADKLRDAIDWMEQDA